MMPPVKGMSHAIPSHVLRVGQTICMDQASDTKSSDQEERDLDISLDNLNQLILDLDPTFELEVKKSPTCVSPPTDDISRCVLVSRGCSPRSLPTAVPSVTPSIPIPTHSGLSCSLQGAQVFSCSPTSCLPPLPFGSAPRRNHSLRHDSSQGSLRLCHSNRNSATSLLSTSTCSDTSYILGSNLSLTGEDPDSPDSLPPCAPGSFSDRSRTQVWENRPSLTKKEHLQELRCKGTQSSPASLSGSQSDIPLLLINGAPEPDPVSPGPKTAVDVPASSPKKPRCLSLSGSQPSMKFVMDTSKFWFRPHISRAEAEACLRDKEAGAFVIRDSTSFRGSFGLAMKVSQSPTCPGEGKSELIRHFLIESSAKGVRIKGSSQEPFFGSLSALVYQHTVSPYALPCRLVLHSQDLKTPEESPENAASEDQTRTACNFVYLDAVPTEMLTGPCAVQKAVTSMLEKASGSFTPALVNLKVSGKGVTLTDINRRLFFRRHYPTHLLSYGGEDPDGRLWWRGSSFGARMFGFVAKSMEAGVENVCHVFAEHDPLQPCSTAIHFIQAAINKQ
ncbi:tensin-4 [Oryzias latipes]|uniref:Tensin 4 n=1 Tax=Oryzias latipes TaxID=8090 RepID=A0A3B3I685_ORYLA|nr:tensin-4 [Oryzias latipes]